MNPRRLIHLLSAVRNGGVLSYVLARQNAVAAAAVAVLLYPDAVPLFNLSYDRFTM